MPSESLMDTANGGCGDSELLARVAASEKDEKLKAAQDVLDNFVKNDRLLSQSDLDRESEKFDEWMQSDSIKKFVEASWEVFGKVQRNDRGVYMSWISAVDDVFDPESVSASTKSEAHIYVVKLSVRSKDGKLYDYEQRYDKAEFILFETFHDKKLCLFRRFFNSDDMRRIKEWASEVRLEHPYDCWDSYRDLSNTPLDKLPKPPKMDHEKFKSICDRLDEEAASGKSLAECAKWSIYRRGAMRFSVVTRSGI